MKKYDLTLDTKGKVPHITIADYGVNFPSEACKLLKYSRYVHVFYDDENKLVAFQPCEKDENAYSFYHFEASERKNVRWSGHRHRNHIAKLLGVEPSQYGIMINGFYSEEDDMLIFDLKTKKPQKCVR